MRKIKFRAWNKEDKIMHDNAQNTYDFGCCNQKNIIYQESFGEVLENLETYEVMQYTGMNDKNDVEIYEGDIVKCYVDIDNYGNDLFLFYEVIFHDTYHCWWLSNIYTNEDEYLHEYSSKHIEVIGNVYDNLKLIK